jgi:hypothetical protein
MGLIFLASAWAGVTVSREPTTAEKTPRVEIPADMDAAKAKAQYKDEYRRRYDRAGLRSADHAVGWQAAGAPCKAGDVTMTLSFADDGHVTKVKAAKGADPELAACVTTAFTGAWLPVFRAEPTLTYTFHFDGAPPAAKSAIELDRGVNVLTFGDGHDGEGLYYQSTGDGLVWYGVDTDVRASLFGAQVGASSYGFTDEGFAIATLRFEGQANAFDARRGLNSRFGASRTDVNGHTYWRGPTVVYEMMPVGTESVALVIFDIERMKHAGLVDRLPGDKTETNVQPRYLQPH